MKLKSIKANCHELDLDNGVIVLFSYETPVAVSLPRAMVIHRLDRTTETLTGVVKTSTKFSATTSRHINSWTATTRTLPQADLEAAINLAIKFDQ